MNSEYALWLDDLMKRVNRSSYQSMNDPRWHRDYRQVLGALTAPAALIKTFNWEVSEAEVRAITTKAVEALEAFTSKLRESRKRVEYPPAFLRKVGEQEVRLASDRWKQRQEASSVYANVAASVRVTSVDVLASINEEIAARKAAIRRPKGEAKQPAKKIEQFELFAAL